MPKAFLIPLTVMALLACCFSASAAAESLVPPGNSAANQYTETFPTSKGEEDEQGKKNNGVTPAQVLGAGKAHELEDKGPAGKAVADFTAETSPTSGEESSGESGSSDGNGGDSGKGKDHSKSQPGANGGNGGDEEKASAGGGGGQAPSGGSGTGAQPSGSSGLGEVVSQATGTSSGTLGWLLPLILIAVIAWSVAYVWRHRQQRVV